MQPHCHHHSVMGFTKDEQLLASAGYDIEVSPGCCGLAGNFGMEKGHYEDSATIAHQGILAKANAAPDRTKNLPGKDSHYRGCSKPLEFLHPKGKRAQSRTSP